jgi:hypothetical protein
MVGATLAVAAVFQLARRHIQRVVDRHFQRRLYAAGATHGLKRAHNFARREPITLTLLVGRDLGDWWFVPDSSVTG